MRKQHGNWYIEVNEKSRNRGVQQRKPERAGGRLKPRQVNLILSIIKPGRSYLADDLLGNPVPPPPSTITAQEKYSRALNCEHYLSMNVSEPENVSSFKTWLVDGGARIHPAVHFQPGSVS